MPYRKKLNKVSKDENPKVKNAKKVIYDGIEFKSGLEAYCYKEGTTRGYKLEYESSRTILHESDIYDSYIYAPISTSKFKDKRSNLQIISRGTSITYTPDFTTTITSVSGIKYFIVIECKGLKTSTYNIKKNLYLGIKSKELGQNFIFIEPHNQAQVRQAFDILDNFTK